jgi:hypothetical protein
MESGKKAINKIANAATQAGVDFNESAKKYTRFHAAEGKCIYTNDLDENTIRNRPSEEKIAEVERERRRDKLYDLMLYANEEELNKFVRLVKESLETDKMFPIDPDKTRDTDSDICDRIYNIVLDGHDVRLKRGYILFNLPISPTFCTIFCPKKPNTLALCDPVKFFDFVNLATEEFTQIWACYLSGWLSTGMFVAYATAAWIEKKPWEDADVWSRGNFTAMVEVPMQMRYPRLNIRDTDDVPPIRKKLCQDTSDKEK